MRRYREVVFDFIGQHNRSTHMESAIWRDNDLAAIFRLEGVYRLAHWDLGTGLVENAYDSTRGTLCLACLCLEFRGSDHCSGESTG